jgi:hypothetical protein
VESEGAYASDLLHAASWRANVKPEDAALATEIVLGVLRWRRQLDFLLERHLKKTGGKAGPAGNDWRFADGNLSTAVSGSGSGARGGE